MVSVETERDFVAYATRCVGRKPADGGDTRTLAGSSFCRAEGASMPYCNCRDAGGLRPVGALVVKALDRQHIYVPAIEGGGAGQSARCFGP